MVDVSIVGPVVTLLAVLDVIGHIYLDWRKITQKQQAPITSSTVRISGMTMALISFSTLLSFFIVFIIIVSWLTNSWSFWSSFLIPLFEVPVMLWVPGLVILSIGIILHGLSRAVRENMATSWEMQESHELITKGPYSVIRHPSYTSYILSFIGLAMIFPSVVTLSLLIGIAGYNDASIKEEQHLIEHFGEEYEEYRKRTSRLIPKVC